jgi:DNA polymerase-3 subunit delta'
MKSASPLLLQKMLQTQKIPHSLLFTGPKGMDLEKIAYDFCGNVLRLNDPQGLHSHKIQARVHPDIHLYYPEGKTGTHACRSLQDLPREAALQPLEGEWQCFIIHDADRMLPANANALLKTFEEPPAKTIIVLLTHFSDRILPTLASRSQIFYFPLEKTLPRDSLHDFLLERLPHLSFSFLEEIAAMVEKQKKEWEKEWKEKQSHDFFLSCETQAKECEGQIVMKFQEKALGIFNLFFEWYRDRWAIECGVQKDLLFFPHFAEKIRFSPLIPLQKVEKSIKEAYLGLERSTKFQTCLEVLCLKLHFLT